MKGIEGKIALVTGASAGIGRAVALAFAEYGAKVALCSRREAEGEETARLVREQGGEAMFMAADVADGAQVEALVRATVAHFGRLDFAVNNAGVLSEISPVAESSEENWDRVIGVNLKGVWLCMKYEIQQMLQQGQGGVIVNMASAGGLVAMAGIAPYIASKHGVLGLTKSAALEYTKQGIRINAICPAGIATEMIENAFPSNTPARAAYEGMHPIGRLGTLDEISHATVWLCSDYMGYMTGASLVIDGGVTAA